MFCFIVILWIVNFGNAKDTGSHVHGFVYNKITGMPIEDVNVYITNSTWGSSTNREGYYSFRDIPDGTHELVVTSIGYEYKAKKIQIRAGSEHKNDFHLKPVIYETETTVVEGSIPTEWLDDLEFFKFYFLGSNKYADDCIIENKEVLDFSKPYNSIFEASALKPLVIKNTALGFRIDCILIDFTFNKSNNTYSWSVKPKFTELEAEDEDQKDDWEDNRRYAFEGSVYHFLRSFCEKNHSKEGFFIQRVVGIAQRIPRREWRPLIIEYDEFTEPGLYPGDTNLKFSNYLHVVYENNYISWIGLNYTSITLDEFGYPAEDNPYMVFGDWAKHGIADLLPKNYVPKN
jgi:hypothetical protein